MNCRVGCRSSLVRFVRGVGSLAVQKLFPSIGIATYNEQPGPLCCRLGFGEAALLRVQIDSVENENFFAFAFVFRTDGIFRRGFSHAAPLTETLAAFGGRFESTPAMCW